MRSLIERLEKAESGSRELDLEIWGNHVAVPRSPRPWKLNVTPPAYTSSLDAIVALIGEKLPGWATTLRLPGSGARKHTCEVIAPDDPSASITDPWPNRASGAASTAPISACIALLRAIEQGGEHG